MKGYIFSCSIGIHTSSLLSSKNLCDLFYFLENLDIASNADDTKIYTINKKKKKRRETDISVLETYSSLLFEWFNNNFMKANRDKSHLIMSCTEATIAMIDGLPIDSCKNRSSPRYNNRS